MAALVIPALSLPFSTATHPKARQVQELTEHWCRRSGLLLSPASAATFGALGYGRLMSTLCPDASLAGLCLVTDWNSFFFIADDQQNNAVATGRAGLYEELLAAMRNVIQGGSGQRPRHGRRLAGALNDLLHRTLPGRPRYWQDRFRRNLDLWLSGHSAENLYKTSGTIPSIENYICVRRDACTVLPTLDLVEKVEGATVPDPLYHTPQWQTLILGIADIMCWVNDIHSLPIEEGDPINLVNVLACHQHLTIQDSIDTVAARITSRVDDYLTAAQALPATMDELGIAQESQAAIMRCVRDQQSWAAGMEQWDRTGTIRHAPSQIPGHRKTASYVEDLLT